MLGDNPTTSRTKHRFLCQYPSELLLRNSRLLSQMRRAETTTLPGVDVVRLPFDFCQNITIDWKPKLDLPFPISD